MKRLYIAFSLIFLAMLPRGTMAQSCQLASPPVPDVCLVRSPFALGRPGDFVMRVRLPVARPYLLIQFSNYFTDGTFAFGLQFDCIYFGGGAHEITVPSANTTLFAGFHSRANCGGPLKFVRNYWLAPTFGFEQLPLPTRTGGEGVHNLK